MYWRNATREDADASLQGSGRGVGGGWRMITTAVRVLRPPMVEPAVLSGGIGVPARAARVVYARSYPRGGNAADTGHAVCAEFGMRHTGCRAEATGIARGWREDLQEQRARPQGRLVLETRREREWRSPARRRRSAVATRKAERESRGVPGHCLGGRAGTPMPGGPDEASCRMVAAVRNAARIGRVQRLTADGRHGDG